MEVQAGNKLIAEFMGDLTTDGKEWAKDNGKRLVMKYEYDTSWDWLMPVVEKIEEMNSRDVDCRISIERDTCNFYYDNQKRQYEFNLWRQGNKILAVWESVTAFLEWYNNSPSGTISKQ